MLQKLTNIVMTTRKDFQAVSGNPHFSTSHPYRHPTRRVLLIDDEAPLRRVTQLTLKITAGWEVWGAASGKEGVQQAELEQPDVILLDLMMPDVDGLSTLKMLQDNPKTQPIPIILLTAKLQTNPQLKLQYSAIKAVLVKPFDPTTLAQEIKKTLNWI